MKKIILLALFTILAFRAGNGLAAGLEAQTGVSFDWWSDGRGSHASQIFTPVHVEGKFSDLSVRFLTAYGQTQLNTAGAGSVGLGHMLDSKLGGTYQITGKLPVDVMFGLDLNLPTGKTNLTAKEVTLIMDPNLVSVNNFGEGFNVNPTLSVAKTWHDWSAALGLGYLWRGPYDFSSDLNLTDYQPGAVYTATAEGRYTISPQMYCRLFGGYSFYGKDTTHGVDMFQEGDVGIFGMGVYYQKPKQWDTSLTFKGVVRGKVENAVTNPDGTLSGALALESGNYHRDEYAVDLLGRYFLDAKTTISVPLQYKKLTSNSYSAGDPSNLAVGDADKVSFGVGVTRTICTALTAEINLKGFYMHGDAVRLDAPIVSSDYTGFNGNIALVGKFN